MTMTKSKTSVRGSYKMAISEPFGIGAVQWIDSKVVNCISSFLDFSERKISRQVGSNKEEFSCPGMMVLYQENMSGVDRVDQMRTDPLASIAHFKKWYKKALFAVIDMMLLNGLHLWNRVAEKIPGRKKLKKHEYLRIIANNLLCYKTKTWMSPMLPSAKKKRTQFVDSPMEHGRRNAAETNENAVKVDDGKATKESNRNTRCLVCSIESSAYLKMWMKQKSLVTEEATRTAMDTKVRKTRTGLRRGVSCCCECEVNAHTNVFDNDTKKKIHRYFPPNMSCMDILHSQLGKEIWSIQRDHAGRCIARVRRGHAVVRQLHEDIAFDLGMETPVGETANGGRGTKRRAT